MYLLGQPHTVHKFVMTKIRGKNMLAYFIINSQKTGREQSVKSCSTHTPWINMIPQFYK